jgi:poly(hydroxyalkanoate) depolymerase family esterase
MRRWSLDASVALVKRAMQRLSEPPRFEMPNLPHALRELVPALWAPNNPVNDPANDPRAVPSITPGVAPPSGPAVVALPDDLAGLSMSIHAPPDLAPGAPLVVLLHGCNQAPEVFAAETGWLARAMRDGFVLLLPGQSSERNAQRCFNWFREADISCTGGEAAAIAAMTRHVVALHRCDPARVFVVGMSAGGAMAACLLAGFPHLYHAGAVVAGLPAAAASGMVGAMTRMAGRGTQLSPAAWAARARALAPAGEAGPWPSLFIWHGLADQVVDPVNATALADQFAALLVMGDASESVSETIILRQWLNRDSAVKLTLIQQSGIGHVYQAPAASGADAFVIKGSYDTTGEICAFWEIFTKLKAN